MPALEGTAKMVTAKAGGGAADATMNMITVKFQIRSNLVGDTATSLKIGRGVSARMGGNLEPRVLDSAGRQVPLVVLEWHSSDRRIIEFQQSDQSAALKKGQAQVWCRVHGEAIESPKIDVEVWAIDD